MKLLLTLCIFISFSFLLSGCGKKNENVENQENNNSLQNNIDISRTSTDNNVAENKNDIQNNNENIDNSTKTTKETELASFSTPLKSGVADRITNIKITCGKINEYTLKNGETFSFNQTVGPCTAEEGYKEAEIYVNKQIKYALGRWELPS